MSDQTPRWVHAVGAAAFALVDGYEGTVTAPEAIVRVGPARCRERIDLVKGMRTPLAETPVVVGAELSPDGKLRLTCREHSGIDVEEVATQKRRTFEFHPDDRDLVGSGCGHWVDDRFVEIELERLAFLDTKTMKLAFLAPFGEDDWHLATNDWAMRAHEGALWIAPIIDPLE